MGGGRNIAGWLSLTSSTDLSFSQFMYKQRHKTMSVSIPMLAAFLIAGSCSLLALLLHGKLQLKSWRRQRMAMSIFRNPELVFPTEMFYFINTTNKADVIPNTGYCFVKLSHPGILFNAPIRQNNPFSPISPRKVEYQGMTSFKNTRVSKNYFKQSTTGKKKHIYIYIYIKKDNIFQVNPMQLVNHRTVLHLQ